MIGRLAFCFNGFLVAKRQIYVGTPPGLGDPDISPSTFPRTIPPDHSCGGAAAGFRSSDNSAAAERARRAAGQTAIAEHRPTSAATADNLQ